MGACNSNTQEEEEPIVFKATLESLDKDTAALTPASSGSLSVGDSIQDDGSEDIIGRDVLVLEWIESNDTSNVAQIKNPLRNTRIEQVYDGVHDGPVLGEGTTGIVRQVTHRVTGDKYAVKYLDLSRVTDEKTLRRLLQEISIMAELDHPNIARLEEVYEFGSDLYIIEELCDGTDLFDLMESRPNFHLTEAETAKLIAQLLSAVSYLHSKGIVHRDLKLENCCFSSSISAGEPILKLVDFGLSSHLASSEVLHEPVGTPYTVAPEVLNCSYDEKCDIWSIGVIAFVLLSGYPPFGDCGCLETLKILRQNIRRGHFVYDPDVVLAGVSSQARHFVKMLLEMNPKSRPTAKEAANLPWLREDHDFEVYKAPMA